ncbi:MAG: FKBP-type peptidyl-prolyl cis-trans isomerase [Thermodesulfobacteriota bacterium]|nr:FKBP-type peptidyl-prolyl cis-trans isomerase [Thermodesulfobacteriota bacterium]
MKKILQWSIACLILLQLIACSSDTEKTAADKKRELDTIEKQFSYTMGFEAIITLKELKSVNLDKKALFDGIEDAMGSGQSVLSPQQMAKIKGVISAKERSLRNTESIQHARENLEKQNAFLVENKDKEGVITTKSGLQYKILKKGNGDHPTITDNVKINFEGRLLDGTVFDSTRARGGPATVRVKGTIPAWGEALQLMREGAEYRFFVPSALAHGKTGTIPEGGVIGPNQMLIMDIELLEIVDPNASPKASPDQTSSPKTDQDKAQPDAPETEDAH